MKKKKLLSQLLTQIKRVQLKINHAILSHAVIDRKVELLFTFGSSLITALFLIFFALLAYRRVDIVSS